MYGIFSKYLPTDQKIQTVANAAVLIFLATRADSNDKRRFVGVRIFHSIYRQKTINLRVFLYLCELRRACSYILGFPRLMPVGILVVIRTALTLVLIYSDSPRLKYAGKAENAWFHIQKCTVCDFHNAKYAQFSDIILYNLYDCVIHRSDDYCLVMFCLTLCWHHI